MFAECRIICSTLPERAGWRGTKSFSRYFKYLNNLHKRNKY